MNPVFAKRGCLSRQELLQYLRGDLGNGQRHEIENHLLDCPLCSAAVEGLAQSENMEEVEEELESLQGLPLRRRAPRPRRTAWANRAAAVGLLLLLAYAGYRYWGATASERLFAAYFQPMENRYITLRSAGEPPIEPELQTALDFYTSGDFTASLPHFRNYLATHPGDGQAALLAANACLQSGEAPAAEAYLLPLESKDRQWNGRVKWSLALAYLKQSKTKAARALLEEISGTDYSDYREEAGKLRAQLE